MANLTIQCKLVLSWSLDSAAHSSFAHNRYSMEAREGMGLGLGLGGVLGGVGDVIEPRLVHDLQGGVKVGDRVMSSTASTKALMWPSNAGGRSID